MRAPSGRPVALRLLEYRGGRIVGSRLARATGNGAWQRLVLTSSAAGGTSLGLEVVVALTPSLKARVDDLTLRKS